MIKALTANTLGIFLLSDIDLARGTAAVYTDDTLQITDTISIATTVGTDVTDLGLTLTGGGTTTAFTTGDTATFEVLPPSTKSSAIVVGASGVTFPAWRLCRRHFYFGLVQIIQLVKAKGAHVLLLGPRGLGPPFGLTYFMHL